VFGPFIRHLNDTANRFVRRFGLEPAEELASARSPEELIALARHSAAEGKLEPDSAELFVRTLHLSELTAENVMTPRVDVKALEAHATATWIPVLDVLQVEPARVPQYAAFFTLGVLAHRHDWLERFDARTGWVWLSGGLAGAALLFAVGADADCFGAGGFDGPSALWAAYDSALCVALCVGLLTLFREAVTSRSRLRVELAADSYGVYIVHLPLVVTVQYCLAGRGLTAAGAWGATVAFAVPGAFLLAAGLRRLPGFRLVL
jgi:hypothetical protein